LLATGTKPILWASCLVAVFIGSLPHENIDGNPVPTLVVFNRHPSLFHALVICDVLAFTGSFFALRIGYQSRIGMLCGCCSWVSIASAFWLAVYALFCDGFDGLGWGLSSRLELAAQLCSK
ncbi:hypothetical protein Tsubulata_050351, partial [Turnera subulata]